jgi:hypothetical protein
MPFLARDAKLIKSIALPNGAATVTSAAIELGNRVGNDFVADCELLITAPALVVGDLANSATMTYNIQQSVDSGSTWTTHEAGAIIQTGAGGVGAAGATRRFRFPTTVGSQIRLQVTNSGAGDASDKSATIELLC